MIHSELGPPTPITDEENALQAYLQANLRGAISQKLKIKIQLNEKQIKVIKN